MNFINSAFWVIEMFGYQSKRKMKKVKDNWEW